MMMDCPRCGFNQPKDQFCANCGVDMENFKVQPQAIWLRLLQNPNLYLSLIGILVVFMIGYIIYSQSESVSRQMNRLLDMPVSSRDAGDPEDAEPTTQVQARTQPATSPREGTRPEPTATSQVAAPPAAVEDAGSLTLTGAHKLDVSHWEIPREALANLLPLAERIGDGNAGRSYLFKSGAKILEQITSVGQRLSPGRMMNARRGEQMTSETPPTTTEAFQFGLFFHIVNVDDKDLGLKWESQLVLPQTETAAESASSVPAVRSIVETRLRGDTTLTTNSLLVIVMEPTNRSPRPELLTRAGAGPWIVFASPEYRAGLTDWLVAVQIKGP